MNGSGHYLAAGVAGHADEACEFLLARLEKTLEGAVGSFDVLQVVCATKAVDVDKVDLIGLQALETVFKALEKRVARTVGNLSRKPNLLAAGDHYFADAALTLAVAICVSGVEVSDAQIDRMIQRRHGFFLVFVHEEAAPA